MISIIICSRSKNVDKELRQNIGDTIGTEYEIICIDNSSNQYSMCSAYNEGVRRANGEYLCFMHEDIRFLSGNWGGVAVRELSNEKVGMIGLIGSTYYDRSMSYWCHSPFCVGHNWVGKEHRVFSKHTTPVDVVTADGLWLVIARDMFRFIRWDEDLFTGFHMYDMDISMQVLKTGRRIRVVPEVEINHWSNGVFSRSFYDACMQFHNKWDKELPVSSVLPLDYCRDEQMSFSLRKISELDLATREHRYANSKFVYYLKLPVKYLIGWNYWKDSFYKLKTFWVIKSK